MIGNLDMENCRVFAVGDHNFCVEDGCGAVSQLEHDLKRNEEYPESPMSRSDAEVYRKRCIELGCVCREKLQELTIQFPEK